MTRTMAAAVLMIASTAGAGAEPVSGSDARKQLFDPAKRTIQVSGKISGQDAAIVRALVPLMEQQLNRKLQYFGAVAMSPDEGFQSEASQSALNYHSVQAADAAALAACNKNRKSGARACVLAARILPEGYKPQPLMLSAAATNAVRKTYVRARSPKAVAASASTGAFGVGTPPQALATCQRTAAAAKDCEIVIQD